MNRLAPVLVASAALAALAGCSAATSSGAKNLRPAAQLQTEATGGDATSTAPDRAASTSPDPATFFVNAVGVYSPDELALLWSARIEAATECMAERGFSLRWDAPTVEDFETLETVELNMWERNSYELAATYGYHRPPTTDPVPMPSLSGDERSAFSGANGREGCLNIADDTIFGAGVHPFSSIFQLTAQVQDYFAAVQDDSAVIAAHERWRECMADAGLDSAVMNHTRFRDEPTVTAEETQVAAQDTECRDASGFTTARREAGRAFIEAWSVEHAEQLRAAAESRAAETARAQAILG